MIQSSILSYKHIYYYNEKCNLSNIKILPVVEFYVFLKMLFILGFAYYVSDSAEYT